MGGCRCTFRNCKAKSDGKTHLFHYPVFDKVRCHQWLTNAQRLEFLSLKVSQLKNRVVCQHHFTDEMFMNFKKDKLKCCAIPTELGPYCKPEDSELLKYEVELSPIKSEYIESEPLNISAEKKAKFSVKYGDFLTNCEVMELDNIMKPKPKVVTIKLDPTKTKKIIRKEKYLNKDLLKDSPPAIKKIKPNNDNIGLQVVPQNEVENVCMNMNKSLPTFNILTEDQVIMNQDEQLLSQMDSYNAVKKSGDQTNRSKINIISEEKYTQPLPILTSLIPVSPSAVLQPHEKITRIIDIDNSNSHKNLNSESVNKSAQNICISNIEQQNEHFTLEKTDSTILQIEKDNAEINSCLKNQENTFNQKIKRLSDARVAAIEKKRNFNKKLKDIVRESLDKLDDQEFDQIKPQELQNSKKNNVGSHLASEPELPSMESYLIKFLDARMKRMEDTLLNRIDVNSKNINQLRTRLGKEIGEEINPAKKKTFSVSTQTFCNEESVKKRLYNEISQYLSLEAKNKVFEDLFINKRFEPKPINLTAKKQR